MTTTQSYPQGLDIIGPSININGQSIQIASTNLTSIVNLIYTGNANKVIRVNSAETEFELVNPSTGITNLTYTAATSNGSINSSTGLSAIIPATDNTNAGLFLPAEKIKLTGIATGATLNSADSFLLDRANHTGSQAISTITDLATTLSEKQPAGNYIVNADYRDLSLTTGVITGGVITASGSTFNISAGEGITVDSTNPLSPVVTRFSWTMLTNIPITNLGTATVTHVYISNTGTVIQEITTPTSSSRRNNRIYLGQIGHQNLVSVGNVIPIPDIAVLPITQIRDLWQSIGAFTHGNLITAASNNLQINKSAGTLEKYGVNYSNDINNPSSINLPAQNPITFRYRTQTGLGNNSVTQIDPTVWDNVGVITPLTGTKATNQRIYINSVGSVVIQYGQQFYNSLSSAISAANREPFTMFTNLQQNFILIAVISVSSDCTDLTDSTKARILKVDDRGQTIFTDGVPLAIRDEGTLITPAAASITFAGEGVSVGTSGDDVVVTISGTATSGVNTDPSTGVYTLLQDLDVTTVSQVIPFDTNDLPCPGIAHSTTTNTSRFVALAAGQYTFAFQPQTYSLNNLNVRGKIWVRKNGVDIPNSAIIIQCSSTDETGVDPIIFPIDLAVNDYVQFVTRATANGKYKFEYQAPNTDIAPSPAVPAIILEVRPNLLVTAPAATLLSPLDNLTFTNNSTAPTPGTTQTAIFSNPSAPRIPSLSVQTGNAIKTLQSRIWGSKSSCWFPTNASAGLWSNAIGAASGTYAAVLVSATNKYTSLYRSRYSNVATTLNQSVGQVQSVNNYFSGATSAFGGYTFYASFGFETWTNGGRLLVGMTSAATTLNTDPTDRTNVAGFIINAANNGAISFCTTNNTGVSTTWATGFSVEANNGFEVYVYCAPGSSEYSWSITNINTGASVSNTVTSANIPSATVPQRAVCVAGNGALTAVNAIQLCISNIYIE